MKKLALVAALLLPACGVTIPDNAAEIALCLANGGTWDSEAGKCKLPEPPTPPVDPPPVDPPVEPPPVEPPQPPPVEPPVTPPPSGCLYPPQESNLKLAESHTPSLLGAILEGEKALGDLRDPSRPGYVVARENNRKLAAWLRGRGYCAFAGQEAVFIRNEDGLWEEYHAAAETDGGWTQNSYRFNHWLDSEGVKKDDPDAPPLTSGVSCEGIPPLHSFVVHQKDIRDGWQKFDATPLVEGVDYCKSIGYNRNPCPAGMEGSIDRLGREKCALNGDRPLFMWRGKPVRGFDGGDEDGGLWKGNPGGFTFEHRKNAQGSLAVCDAVGQHCQSIL